MPPSKCAHTIRPTGSTKSSSRNRDCVPIYATIPANGGVYRRIVRDPTTTMPSDKVGLMVLDRGIIKY